MKRKDSQSFDQKYAHGNYFHSSKTNTIYQLTHQKRKLHKRKEDKFITLLPSIANWKSLIPFDFRNSMFSCGYGSGHRYLHKKISSQLDLQITIWRNNSEQLRFSPLKKFHSQLSYFKFYKDPKVKVDIKSNG